MFHYWDLLQRRRACFGSKLQTKRKDFAETTNILQDLTAADLERAMGQEVLPQKIRTLLDKVYAVGATVPGSAASLRNRRSELQGLVI